MGYYMLFIAHIRTFDAYETECKERGGEVRKGLLNRISRKWMKLRLQPIRVFCFHHVSTEFDSQTMWECDWVNTDVLKRAIIRLQTKGYEFISLPEAHGKLKLDKFRCRKYAVLTADDGFKTLLNIIPWLIEHKIPITLFVNSKYIFENGIGANVQDRLDVTKATITNKALYLKQDDIEALQSPLVTYAYHGYEHLDEWKMDEQEFEQNIEKEIESMRGVFPNVIPYYAHTYGRTKKGNDEILKRYGLTPVYSSGNVNYSNKDRIDREILSVGRI